MEIRKNDWQCGKSLSECNLFMLENNVSDVCFKIISDKEEEKREPVCVKALKTLLAARSPVFYAMFCDELKEDNNVIEVNDVDPKAFYELIRFIYTDEVNLTPGNVMYIRYAAEKYLVTKLVEQCKEFISQNLTAENAAIILDSSLFYGDKELQEKSLKTLQFGGKKAISEDSFANIARATLKIILQSEKLAASETQLFTACVGWAKSQCSKLNIAQTKANLRDVLGQEFFLVRFPAMDVTEFEQDVLPHDLFSDQEGYALFKYFHSPIKQEDLSFSCLPREDLTKTRTLCFSSLKDDFWYRGYYDIQFSFETNYSIIITELLFHNHSDIDTINISIVQNNETLLKSSHDVYLTRMKGLRVFKVAISPVLIESGQYTIHTSFCAYSDETTKQSKGEMSDDIIHFKAKGKEPNILYAVEYSISV